MKTPLFARAGIVLVLLALALLGASPGTAAGTAQPRGFQYDALGDSYAAGAGVPPYGDCGRSQAAYAVQLDGRMQIDLDDFVACAGARTADIAAQLGALDEDTDVVTISVGGNDIGWSQAVGACLAGPSAACTAAVNGSKAAIDTLLRTRLHSVYAAIAAAAPNAHVFVTGYPRLFSPEYGDFTVGPLLATVAEQETLNQGADFLNSVIAQVAADHGFEFVDVTKRFLDHGVNAPEPWVLGPLDPGAFHPNLAGYRAYTAAVTAAIVPARLR